MLPEFSDLHFALNSFLLKGLSNIINVPSEIGDVVIQLNNLFFLGHNFFMER